MIVLSAVDQQTPLNLFHHCVKTFRAPNAIRLRCTTNENNYITDSNQKFTKTCSGWDLVFVSDAPLSGPTSYFEIQFGYQSDFTLDGLLVGVTSDPNYVIESESSPLDDTKACALYNDGSGYHYSESAILLPNKTGSVENGGVFGVLVDWYSDQIRFYVNGDLAGHGKKKPSSFRNLLYVFVAPFYNKSSIQVVHKYNVHNLVA
jgi:hypothetical protein